MTKRQRAEARAAANTRLPDASHHESTSSSISAHQQAPALAGESRRDRAVKPPSSITVYDSVERDEKALVTATARHRSNRSDSPMHSCPLPSRARKQNRRMATPKQENGASKRRSVSIVPSKVAEFLRRCRRSHHLPRWPSRTRPLLLPPAARHRWKEAIQTLF